MTAENTSAGRVLAAATVGLAFNATVMTVASFGVFVLPLSRAFGWGRGDISLAMTSFQLVNIAAFPIAGWLIDLLGVRRVLIWSIILYGLAFGALSLVSGSIWLLYGGYAVLALAGIGTTSLAYTRLIVSWYSLKRGLALGTALAGMGVGVAVVPVVAQFVTLTWSWRSAYIALGALEIGACLPFVIPWAWDPPSLVRDARASRLTLQPLQAGEMEFREAIRSRNFFLLIACFGLLGLLTGAIPTHLVPLLVERGLTATRAAIIASLLGFSLIGGRVCTGYLLDRMFAPLLMIIIIAVAVFGLAVLMMGTTQGYMAAGVILMGLSIGADGDMLSYLISRYIGLRAFTRSLGILLAAFTIGACAGPALMGYSVKVSGTYQLALRVLIAATAIAAIPMLLMGPYPDGARRLSGRHAMRVPEG